MSIQNTSNVLPPNQNILTQLKRQVDQARCRQYSLTRQKKQLKHYSLYLKQITKIQRYFRGYLVRKTKSLQSQVLYHLTLYQNLHILNQTLCQQLQDCTQAIRTFRNSPNHLQNSVHTQKQALTQQIRHIIRSVITGADEYAKNSAVTKLTVSSLHGLKKQEKELKAQIKELELQGMCYKQRIGTWGEKLTEIRARIREEMAQKKAIQDQLREIEERESRSARIDSIQRKFQ